MHNSSTAVRFWVSRGFTAVEMMVVVLLIALFTALALPSFENAIKRYRVDTAASEIAEALQFARAEAIRTGNAVTVASSRAATPGCTAELPADWHCGIDVLVTDPATHEPMTLKTIPAIDLNGVSVALAPLDAANMTSTLMIPSPSTPGAVIYSPLGFVDYTQGGIGIDIWPSSETNPATASHADVVCLGTGGKFNILTASATTGC